MNTILINLKYIKDFLRVRLYPESLGLSSFSIGRFFQKIPISIYASQKNRINQIYLRGSSFRGLITEVSL